MKHLSVFLLGFLMLVGIACSNNNDEVLAQKMAGLLENNNYFGLRDVLTIAELQLPKDKYLYYKTLCDNAFFNSEDSNKSADLLLMQYGSTLDDTTIVKLLDVKSSNYIREYQYAEATDLLQTIVEQYASTLDSTDVADYQNSIQLYGSLASVKPQRIHKQCDVLIPSYQNEFAHLIVPVRCGGKADGFIFDTGANISTITYGVATDMGLSFIEANISVGSSTDIRTQAQLAVADSIEVGGILFENVVFLVMPDELLTFPSIGYEIHGIIGLPVISQMEEIRMNSDGTIFTPFEVVDKGIQNMYLDGQNPVVQLLHENDTLLFFLDTGANTSELSVKYYNAHEEDIKSKGTLRNTQRGGAGGMVNVEEYVLSHFSYTIGTNSSELPEISVQTNSRNLDYDGTIGQDIFGQFDKLILNFKFMYLDFE